MGENLRIYIGGLGSSVQEDDLKKTFTSPQLGAVQSVEIIRSKGRSFAYLEFVPASDKGLAKLFSAYNGCKWKGGRLKLEKASEHYLSRLRREWTEDAELEIKSSSENVDVIETVHVLQKPKIDQDIEKLQLKMFFPKLRKIKPIPLKGTGKHKYSFQRVEVPPLPIHFCDCEEHSGPPESAKRNVTDHHETDTYGVNDDELNMMKSILDKLLEKNDSSKTVYNEAEFAEGINKDTTYADNLQVDDNEEEQANLQVGGEENEEEDVSDEDNLVINIVGKPSKRAALFEDWGQKTTPANQDSLVKRIPKIHGSNKEKLPDKKRKQVVHENSSNDIIPSKKKLRNGGLHGNIDDPVALNTQPTHAESRSIQLSSDVRSSRKKAWTNLVTEKESTAFRISDILADPNPQVEAKPKSDPLAPAPCSSENDGQEHQSSQDRELLNVSDQSTKPSALFQDDKSARGTSWLQKSSWLQLVGDTNKSTFNLAQIVPDATFEKEEAQKLSNSEFSNWIKFVSKDTNSPINNNKDIYATLGNDKMDVSTKEQNYAGLDGEQPDCELTQTIVEKGEVSAPTHGTNLLQSYRVVPEIVISETCPFMKSAASMKEWMKTKAALGASHKKTGKGKGASPKKD